MNKYLNKQTLVKDISLTLLSEGKTIRIKAHGYSMFPCIKPGSTLLIEPVKLKGPPLPGEIIAVKRENGLVVHRLTKIINQNGITKYIARGDSNSLADKPVMLSMIVGRIVRAETSGENQVLADIRIDKRPNYILNRFRVIFIFLRKKIHLTWAFRPLPPKGGIIP